MVQDSKVCDDVALRFFLVLLGSPFPQDLCEQGLGCAGVRKARPRNIGRCNVDEVVRECEAVPILNGLNFVFDVSVP